MPIKRKTHLSQRKNSKRFREKLQLLQSRSTQNSVSEEDQKVSIENTVSVSTSSSLNRRAKGSSSSQEPSLVLENFDDHAFNTVSSATKQSNKKPINCTGIEGQLAANDSENADVLWCKPMPSQSVPREGKVNMALIKVSLSNLHSTSTLSSAEGRPKLITTSDDQMDSCHDCDDTFTVVGMELVTPSTDSSDKILQAPMSCKSKTSTHTIAQRPLVTENRQVSYEHNHDVTKFMNEVKESVAKLLFTNWVCAAVDEKILVKLMSPTELSCTQRQISISRNGQVSMIVHGEPLASDHELWSFLPAIPDSCYSVDEFGRYVLSVVRCVTRFDICKGIEDEFYEKHLYILQESSILDENKYKEARYKTTYRAVECLRLITLPRHRCQPCTKVKAMVDKRVKRLMSNVPVHPVSNPPVVTSSKRKRQHCRVKNCKTVRDSLSQTISLFKPVGGRETLEKWVQLTGQKRLIYLPIDSLLKTSLRVCHLHFAAEDLQRTDMTMKLRKNSIPTKFPDGHSPLSENDMKDWRSTNQYKRYWARIESQTPKSREIRTGFPSFQENFTSANDEPSGPFPCLYCETIHTSLNQSCAPTLEGSLESPHLQTQSSVSSFEGTRMAKEEVADILLSL